MIKVTQKGDFFYLINFLKRVQNRDSEIYAQLKPFAEEGVRALEQATPIDTGKTAKSWSYKIILDKKTTTIVWENDNVESGNNVAILLQYGHATGTGGYVNGYDYINPAIRPIFDKIESNVWQNITKK
jgi:hypothetical protein